MATRILHCGKSIVNYNLCIEHKVAGFTRRGPEIGDTLFIVVRRQNQTLCGLRAEISEATDFRPWPDNENYVIFSSLFRAKQSFDS